MSGARAVVCVVVMGLSACGFDPLGFGLNELTPDAAPVPDADFRTLTGTVIDTYHTEQGVQEVASDLTGTAPQAWQYAAGHGEEGMGTVNGLFSFSYLLRDFETTVEFQYAFVVTNADEIDLGTSYWGRRDVVSPTGPTDLVFSVSGLRSWRQTDRISYVCANQGVYVPFTPGSALTTGTTSLGLRLPTLPLVDEVRGDRVTILQEEQATVSGVSFYRPIRRFDAPAYTTQDGIGSLVVGGFQDVVADETLGVGWNVSAFASHADDVHPDGVAFVGALGLHVLPGGAPPSSLAPSVLSAGNLSPSQQIDSLSVAYGNPFPDDWPLFVFARMQFVVEVALRSAERTFLFAEISHAVGEDEFDGLVRVLVSPPRLPKIDGVDSRMGQVGVGSSPTLSWDPPAIGTPTGYEVEVIRLVYCGNATTTVSLARFTTTDTEVRIPRDLLITSATYFMRVTAIWMPNTDLTTAPHATSLPLARADLLVGPVVPR